MDPQDVYFHTLRAIPPPTPDEMAALLVAVKQGDPAARTRLIEANLGLVIAIARGFQRCGLDRGDLIGEGNLGLVRAAHTFDPAAAIPFAAWASTMIRWHILAAIRRQGGRRGTRYRTRVNPGPPDPATPDPHDDGAMVEAVDEAAYARRVVRKLLDRLDRRARTIISLRFGIDGDGPLTMVEIGRRLGLTREWVRRLQVLALRRLAGDAPGADPSAATAPGRRRGPAAPTPSLLAGWVLDPDEAP